MKYKISNEEVDAIRKSPPPNMTLQQAAVYMACSPRKLRDLVLARHVKSARIGAKIVINRKWIDEYLGLEVRHVGR